MIFGCPAAGGRTERIIAMSVKPVNHKLNKGRSWLQDWRLYVMLILPVAFYLIFCYKPMIGIIVAFEKYNLFKGMWGSPWVGL